MRKFILLVFVAGIFLLSNCSSGSDKNFNPDTCLSKNTQALLLQEMVRYASKLPPHATHQTKFSDEFNWYYDRAVSECRIMQCYQEETDTSYLILIARKARSITPMEEGFAIRIKFDTSQKMKYYEEVFRTWKMPTDTLNKRGKFLFETLVNGNDLTLYHSKYQRDRYIEFPDERFYFDKTLRKWNDRELDTVRLD